MDFPKNQDLYVKGGTIIHIMKYLGITRGSGCSVNKVFINTDYFIQYGIDYSVKYNRTNMVRPCVVSINYDDSNTVYNSI